MKEIISLRKAKEKHFLCEDGTFKAFCYKDDIHYLDNGEYKEIDNTLIKQEDYYINKSNDFNVLFTSCVDKNLLYKILLKDKFLEVLLAEKKQDNNKIEVKNNEITYVNLLENVDFKYEIIGKKLKETIILNQNNYSQIRFILRTNLNLKLNNNVVYAYDNDTLIYKFESPFVYNDEKNLDINLEYELNSYNDCYELILKFDKEKLNNVLFPVYIDPTISTDTEGEVYDTYIYPNDESVDRNNQDYLKIGVDSNNVIYRTLLKFDLPTIGSASQVVNATLYLTSHQSDFRYPLHDLIHEKISVHEITTSWTEETATWNNLNDKYNSTLENYAEFLRTEQVVEDGKIKYNLHINDINITNLVKKWYSGTENNGLMLKFINENYNSDCKEYYLYSKNNSVSQLFGKNPKPFLTITYRNQNGMLDYMSYSGVELNDGIINTNLYNGNLISSFKISSTLDNRFPVNLELIYNTNDAILKSFNNGWRFNMEEKIIPETINNTSYIKYLDGSSNISYFYQDGNVFISEDSDDLKIETENNYYVIKDKNNNKKYFSLFNNEYLLVKIKDSSDLEEKLLYDNKNRLIKVIDSYDDEIIINYTSNNIIITSDINTTTITLQNNLISSISTLNTLTNILYNNNNLITSISELNGKTITIEYYNTIPYRVKKIKEYGIDNEEGKNSSYEYSFNTTKVISDDNITYTYTFNNYGNTIGTTIIDEEGKLYKSYGFNQKYIDFKHNISSATSIIKYSRNLIENGDFETTDCSLIYGGERTTETSYSGNYSYKTNDSFIITGESIENNCATDYQLSFYIKNEYPIELKYFATPTQSIRNLCSDHIIIPPHSNFTLFSYVFNTYHENYASIVLDTGGHIAYVDDIYVSTEDTSPIHRNILNNSNFENGFNNWSISGQSNVEELGISNVAEIVSINDEEYALKIKSHPDSTITASYHLGIGGSKGDIYNLSFWYKNEGVIDGDFEFQGNIANIQFIYTDEEMGSGTENASLNIHDKEWQFFSESFVASEDYEDIYLNILSLYEANNLYVTNVMLIKNLNQFIFKYDDEGNLLTINDLSNNTNNLKYDKNNQLIGMFTPRGSHYKYEYDNEIKTKVLKAISSSGIANEIEYDSNNNPVKARVINLNNDPDIINNNQYSLRLKGTNKYVDVVNNVSILVKEKQCNNKKFILIQHDNYYKVKYLDKYISIDNNNNIVLSNDLGDSSLFSFIKKNNGSYNISPKNINSKHIASVNDLLVLEEANSNSDQEEFYLEKFDDSIFIENKAEYSNDGKYISKIIDSLGKETLYENDKTTGFISKVIDANENTINYSYNNKKLLKEIKNNNKKVEYLYNNQNLLEYINTTNNSYKLEYDNFLNIKNIKINNNQILSNSFEPKNGNLLTTTYGNGNIITNTYDKFNRKKTFTIGDKTYRNVYDNLGNLSRISSINETHSYYYDIANRLSEYIYKNNNDEFAINYKYDAYGNEILKKFIFNYLDSNDEVKYLENSINYEYNADDSIIKVSFDSLNLNYTYDILGRLTSKSINSGHNIEYSYYTLGNKTSLVIKSIKIDNDLYEYTYDNLYNITIVYLNGNKMNEYIYDTYSQLTIDKNYLLNLLFEYNYDSNGNIRSRKIYNLTTNVLITADLFEYNNQNWKDLLTKYNNEEIKYDSIGNITKIGEKQLTWKNGKQLSTYEDNNQSLSVSYDYNADGIRISKNVNNKLTKYFLDDDNIILEKRGNDMLYYLRDDDGDLIGFKYNNVLYYYIKNLQNDIIGLKDSNFNTIARYYYDSFGSLIKVTDANLTEIQNNNHIAFINPFRYRSYYYDAETKMYYLKNRYYNPEWGRFISADEIVTDYENILQYNLFQYVFNNPINGYDDDGAFPKLKNWHKVAIGVSIVAGLTVATVLTGGAAAAIAGAALQGTIIGGVSGAAVGAVGGAITGGKQGAIDGACSGFLSGTIIGGITGAAGAAINIRTGTTVVEGKAHGAKLHKVATNVEAGKMTFSSKYKKVFINKSLKTSGLNGNLRPDAIGIAKNGIHKIVEVVSPKQSISYINNKVGKMVAKNPGSIGKVVTWVRKLFRK